MERQNSYKIVLPLNVQRLIKEWCKKSHTTEWSGTLFYRPSGSFEENNLTITVVDFYVSDIGSGAYTEYDVKPEIVSYMVDNELLDCKMGLIHSHNNMSAFFSGTDSATLVAEGTDSPHFVSLIVCNNGPYVAKITRRITEEGSTVRKTTYPTFDDETVVKESPVENHSYIEAFPLTIVMEEDESYKDSVSKRYDEIMAEKKAAHPYGNPSYPGYGGYGGYNGYGAYKGGASGSGSPKTFLPAPKEGKEGKEEEKGKEITFSDNYPHFSSNLLKAYAGQILFGSVTISSESFDKLDKKKWIETNMAKSFDRRFGTSEEGFEDFRYWASNYIDIIVNTASDPALEKEGITKSDMSSILASDLIEVLEGLLGKQPHKYLDEIIEVLTDYVFIEDEDEDPIEAREEGFAQPSLFPEVDDRENFSDDD